MWLISHYCTGDTLASQEYAPSLQPQRDYTITLPHFTFLETFSQISNFYIVENVSNNICTLRNTLILLYKKSQYTKG